MPATSVSGTYPSFPLSLLPVIAFDNEIVPFAGSIPALFTPFSFSGSQYAATITLRRDNDGDKLYTVEAVEIENAEGSPRSSDHKDRQGAQPSVSLRDRIAYYVGDVNATNPSFIEHIGDTPSFSPVFIAFHRFSPLTLLVLRVSFRALHTHLQQPVSPLLGLETARPSFPPPALQTHTRQISSLPQSAPPVSATNSHLPQ